MSNYIDRGVAIARITALEVTNKLATMADARRLLADMPAADVAPVVHGQWNEVDWVEMEPCGHELVKIPNSGLRCNNCRNCFKKELLWKRNYCPNCGARMDGDKE